MKQIYFATRNSGKVNSMNNILSKYEIEVVQMPIKFSEPKTDDIQEIARQKVLAAYGRVKRPVIALDSGFYIYSLNGFPKADINPALEKDGIEGILRLVKGKPRECEFRLSLAYYDGELSEPKLFETNAKGSLSTEPRGEMKEKYHWSELSLVFIPNRKIKTIAEMSIEEYLEWETQRYGDCFTEFARWLSQRRT